MYFQCVHPLSSERRLTFISSLHIGKLKTDTDVRLVGCCPGLPKSRGFREPNPGPIPGATGLSSCWISCLLCASAAFCVATPVPLCHRSGDAEGDAVSWGCQSPCAVPPDGEAFSCSRPKNNCRRFLHPAAGSRPGNSGAAESSHFP